MNMMPLCWNTYSMGDTDTGKHTGDGTLHGSCFLSKIPIINTGKIDEAGQTECDGHGTRCEIRADAVRSIRRQTDGRAPWRYDRTVQFGFLR